MQERELIWDNCTGKGFFTYFRTDCHGKRQPQDQDRKRRNKSIAHSLNDIHQANGAQDAVLPLSGHLVGMSY